MKIYITALFFLFLFSLSYIKIKAQDCSSIKELTEEVKSLKKQRSELNPDDFSNNTAKKREKAYQKRKASLKDEIEDLEKEKEEEIEKICGGMNYKTYVSLRQRNKLCDPCMNYHLNPTERDDRSFEELYNRDHKPPPPPEPPEPIENPCAKIYGSCFFEGECWYSSKGELDCETMRNEINACEHSEDGSGDSRIDIQQAVNNARTNSRLLFITNSVPNYVISVLEKTGYDVRDVKSTIEGREIYDIVKSYIDGIVNVSNEEIHTVKREKNNKEGKYFYVKTFVCFDSNKYETQMRNLENKLDDMQNNARNKLAKMAEEIKKIQER